MIKLCSHSLSIPRLKNTSRSVRLSTNVKAQSQDGEIKKTQRRGKATKKTGQQLRDEYFMAAQTGQERGLPEGAFLNDNTTGEEPQVAITFEPYGDKINVSQGSSILKAGVEAGAFTIGPMFCLTGQCDSCMVELDTGEVKLGCMHSIPTDRSEMTITVVGTDEAWEAMCAGGSGLTEDEDTSANEEDDLTFV
eukprot:g7053.t1